MLFTALSMIIAGTAPTVGGAAFVVDATVVVRKEPVDTAPAVREIPIWTAVRVEAVDKGWARVVVGPRFLRYDNPGSEARPLAPSTFDPSWPVGFVRVDAIDADPPSRLALIAQAKSAADPARRQVLILRAWSLDPNDDDVAALVGPAIARAPVKRKLRSPFESAHLVYGCRGDLVRDNVVSGLLPRLGGVSEPSDGRDVCVAHVELRAPCMPTVSRDDAAIATYKATRARLMARFGKDGPALRLTPSPGVADRPLFVVTHLLEAEECSDTCTVNARTTDLHVDRLRVPRVDDGYTKLHVVVPRYEGVIYDVENAETKDDVDATPLSFEIEGAFDVNPRAEVSPLGEHMSILPDVCCECDAP